MGFGFTVFAASSLGFVFGLLSSDESGTTSVGKKTTANVVGEEPEAVEVVYPELELKTEPKAEEENPSKKQVDDLIDYFTAYYKSKPEVADIAKKIVMCESTYRQYKNNEILLGSAGEKGIAQYKQKTFDLFKGYYGQLNLSIDNWQDQIRLLVIMISEGQGKHWSCFYK